MKENFNDYLLEKLFSTEFCVIAQREQDSHLLARPPALILSKSCVQALHASQDIDVFRDEFAVQDAVTKPEN